MPRRPSLKVADDEHFFELIGENLPNDTEVEETSAFVEAENSANLSSEEKKWISWKRKKDDAVTSKHSRVPTRVRKLEIELVQRKLPRYPSKTHLTEASFYPLASSDPLPEMTMPIDSQTRHEDDDTEYYEDVEYYEGVEYYEDVEYSDESEFFEVVEYSDDSGDDEEAITEEGSFPASGDEEDHNIIHEMHYWYETPTLINSQIDHDDDIEDEDHSYDDEEEMTEDYFPGCEDAEEPNMLQKNQKRICIDIDETVGMEESFTSYCNDSSSGVESEESKEEPSYEPRIGVVRPSIQCMIMQARMELRSRKVPEEHKMKYKNPLAEALEIAKCMRLNEHTVETYGEQIEKYKATELPSVTWKKGQETVVLPHFNDPTPEQFTIFKEAVALGGISALKPEITTNYDRLRTNESFHHDEVDVDDSGKHKYMRTRYLTDQYLRQEQNMKVDNEDDEIKSILYKSLDDVELPTTQCPVRVPVAATLTNLELKEALSQQVAEKVWERRYRLERPRAQQRITFRCTCKFCKTASPYQTFAYRKKWLIQKNLWKEPPLPVEKPRIEDRLEPLPGFEKNANEVVDDYSMDTGNSIDSSDSDANSFAIEEYEVTNENRPDGIQSIIPHERNHYEKREKVKQMDPFMVKAQSLLSKRHHSELKKEKTKWNGFLRNGIHSVRSFLGTSLHRRKKTAGIGISLR